MFSAQVTTGGHTNEVHANAYENPHKDIINCHGIKVARDMGKKKKEKDKHDGTLNNHFPCSG